VVGRGGFEPPTSAVTCPERCNRFHVVSASSCRCRLLSRPRVGSWRCRRTRCDPGCWNRLTFAEPQDGFHATVESITVLRATPGAAWVLDPSKLVIQWPDVDDEPMSAAEAAYYGNRDGKETNAAR